MSMVLPATAALAEDANALEVSKNVKLLCDPKVDVSKLTFNGARLGGKIEDVKGSDRPSERDLKSGDFIGENGLRYEFDKESHVIKSVMIASRNRGEMQDVQSVAAAEALFGKADEIRPDVDEPETRHLIYKKRGMDVCLDRPDVHKPTLQLYSIEVTLPG
jgi:hypothetical protein